jgi:hypothetical protein
MVKDGIQPRGAVSGVVGEGTDPLPAVATTVF